MLHVHRSERADGLVRVLRDLMAEPLDDPFAEEVVAVPTRGMERWLSQRMATHFGVTEGRHDGVCANVDFPSPRGLASGAVATAVGLEPRSDPWLPEHSVWALLAVLDECLEEDWLRSLAAHLGYASGAADESRKARRFSTARHLVELFDRYALHRPDMVLAWADGESVDNSGRELSADAAWQAELWRRLRSAIGQASPAERLADACRLLRDDADAVDIPARVSLFGLTRLPAGHFEVFRALATYRDIHLFLLHPSPALWDRIAAVVESEPGIVRREEDKTETQAANGLLRSWGNDARELQLVVGSGSGDEEAHLHHEVEQAGASLLGLIQADVRADRRPPGLPLPGEGDARPLLEADDRSLQIHSCHGRARQVEVLRDAILHLLAEDPTLEPRDIIVMCPDIEEFAPLIRATFGVGAVALDDDSEGAERTSEAPGLRVRLADRALRQTNPLLGVLSEVIELADRRITASAVLDLADHEPVRRRFGFDDDDLARLQAWVAASGIRWGLDAPDRAPFKLESVADGTWREGLDRLLLGVTMTEDANRLFKGVLPLDDVESGSIELAGRLAEFVDRLDASLESLRSAKTLSGWVEAIGKAASRLASATPRDEWQRLELERILAEIVEQARVSEVGSEATLELPEVRALLAERLQGRPTRANFRTGNLTMCTLVPMRSVPHRVVCLLGLDDGAFPRKGYRDGDDLMLADPQVGDRDSRAEDRQMLLDALLAATDRLLITYTGNDERTNTPRPAAVPVGELLDIIDQTARIEDGEVRRRVVTRHPLQPFDPRNFKEGQLGVPAAWSFDRVSLAGARSLGDEPRAAGPFLEKPLPPGSDSVIELDDLIRFVERPVRAFLRQRLGVSLADYSEDIIDALPIELDGLEAWTVGQRLLEGLLAGADIQSCVDAERARGTLPAGNLGTTVLNRVRPSAEQVAQGAKALLGEGERSSTDIDVTLADGRTVRGTARGLSGNVFGATTYSRLNARHRLGAWVRLLVATASRPELPFEAVSVGRPRSGARPRASVTVARVPPLSSDANERSEIARRYLADLVDIFDRGMREPLPIACMASAAYAEAGVAGRSPEAAGQKAWESNWKFDKEDKELDHQLAFGGVRSFEELLAEPPRPDEGGPGWDASEETRFGRYSRRLWDPILAVEEVVDQ